MLAGFQGGRVTAFCVVGFREEAGGAVSGPHLIRRVAAMKDARELCLAVLWLESEKWVAVAITDLQWVEIARYRRFPPSRQIAQVDDSAVVWGVTVYRARARGARLSLSSAGGKRKSFGGNSDERSGFEGI